MFTITDETINIALLTVSKKMITEVIKGAKELKPENKDALTTYLESLESGQVAKSIEEAIKTPKNRFAEQHARAILEIAESGGGLYELDKVMRKHWLLAILIGIEIERLRQSHETQERTKENVTQNCESL